MTEVRRVLVVGAGFAGATYARLLAEAGHMVHIIDKRDHIAGNCFDFIDESGVRVHRYGPHLFHTSNMRIVEWLSQFTEWTPYTHCVVAKLPDERLVPMPVNLETVEAVIGRQIQTSAQLESILDAYRIANDDPATAEQFLLSKIGPELTDLFYRPYTQKMWGLDLSEISPDIVKRLKIRDNRDPRYFPDDAFQALPMHGYLSLFEKMLDHTNISVSLSTSFSDELADEFDSCFNSMPIDEYFGFDLGHLPYRSVRFHHNRVNVEDSSEHSVINYTDDSPFTRETWWHNFPGHQTEGSREVIRTVEEPCDYKDNDLERFYPVKSADGSNEQLYKAYAERQPRHKDMQFIGRCGTYQYLDMHQVVNQSMAGAYAWLKLISD